MKETFNKEEKAVDDGYIRGTLRIGPMRFDNHGNPLPGGKLEVKINLHGNIMPECHGEWTDLYTAEEVEMDALEFRIISLGYSMELPKDYYAEVAPRSSTCKNWGIIMANSIGIIENSYCGDDDIWGFPAVAIRPTKIPKGTRICQFRLVEKAVEPDFDVVESLGNKNRGGFGSTGA